MRLRGGIGTCLVQVKVGYSNYCVGTFTEFEITVLLVEKVVFWDLIIIYICSSTKFQVQICSRTRDSRLILGLASMESDYAIY